MLCRCAYNQTYYLVAFDMVCCHGSWRDGSCSRFNKSIEKPPFTIRHEESSVKHKHSEFLKRDWTHGAIAGKKTSPLLITTVPYLMAFSPHSQLTRLPLLYTIYLSFPG